MKTFLFSFFIVPLITHGQINRAQFFMEPSVKLAIFNFTEMNGGGNGDPFLMRQNQIRLEGSFSLLYRGKMFNLGVGSSIISIGSNVNESAVGRFFLFSSAFFHLGYNLFSIIDETNFCFGPFANFGLMKTDWSNYDLRKTLAFGLEFYNNNQFKIAFSFGLFNLSNYEKSIQKLNNYYTSNNILSIEISRVFSFRK